MTLKIILKLQIDSVYGDKFNFLQPGMNAYVYLFSDIQIRLKNVKFKLLPKDYIRVLLTYRYINQFKILTIIMLLLNKVDI